MGFFDLFRRKDPKDLFLAYDPKFSTWRVVGWNFDLVNPDERQWTLETHGTNEQIIKWTKNSHEEVAFLNSKKLLGRKEILSSDFELKALMNLSIHSTLKYSIEENHEFMVTAVSGATTLDMQNETRALQWVQATFGTLLRALDSFKKDPSLVLTGACFSGLVPETGERVLRVLIFNLDIFYYLRPDYSLQIVIFDDKNLGHGESKAPTFQQIIKVTKPQFYDEIVKLVHRIANVGEIL